MKNALKIIVICVALINVLPCSAKINGTVSKSSFYDLEKTLMLEVTPDTTLKTGKYWEKNLFYLNKYRPIFILSNNDLYNLVPEKKANSYQRIFSPTVYNISLKDSSLKKVSLSQPTKLTEQKTTAPIAVKKAAIAEKHSAIAQTQDILSTYLFEQAKNKGVASNTKLSTAIALKHTKKLSNYTLALDLLNDVTRVEPYNAAAYNLKAEIYLELNNPELAMKNYIEVLNLNPYSKESCLGIAKILEPTNKTLAQKYYDRASQ